MILTTNELKKSTRVKLANGWEARIEDNRKGNVRMATVFGTYEEMGSIYSHDIIAAFIDNMWVPITQSEKQQSCKKLNDALFG